MKVDKIKIRTDNVKVDTTTNHNTFSITLPKSMDHEGKHYTVDWTSVRIQDDGYGYYASAVYEKITH